MTETEVAIAAGAASAAATNAANSSNPSEEQDQLHGWHLFLGNTRTRAENAETTETERSNGRKKKRNQGIATRSKDATRGSRPYY